MVTGWPNLSNTVDDVFLLIMGISLVLLIGITSTMIYFTVRFSRKRNPRPENIEGNLALEIAWTVIPTLLVLAIFYAGWKGFQFMRTVPKDAMLVQVTARMWSWSFRYENGRESGVLTVPLERPVKLAITSSDVLHSLYIPAFRVKEDCVPGMETYLWFLPSQTGAFDLFCTEYCGAGHSGMITKVQVLTRKEFNAWYQAGKPATAAKAAELASPRDGKKLIHDKGCIACHSTDGTPKVGPTFKGISGRATTVVSRGKEREILVDEEYLRLSILEPQADVVKGFPPIMPSQKGLLTEGEITAIIEYLNKIK